MIVQGTRRALVCVALAPWLPLLYLSLVHQLGSQGLRRQTQWEVLWIHLLKEGITDQPFLCYNSSHSSPLPASHPISGARGYSEGYDWEHPLP